MKVRSSFTMRAHYERPNMLFQSFTHVSLSLMVKAEIEVLTSS